MLPNVCKLAEGINNTGKIWNKEGIPRNPHSFYMEAFQSKDIVSKCQSKTSEDLIHIDMPLIKKIIEDIIQPITAVIYHFKMCFLYLKLVTKMFSIIIDLYPCSPSFLKYWENLLKDIIYWLYGYRAGRSTSQALKPVDSLYK